jgi:hypothetical protein
MNPALWAALGAGAAVLLLLAGAGLGLLLSARRTRARESALAQALTQVEALSSRVEELAAERAATHGPAATVPEPVGYVITTAGDLARDEDASQAADRAVLSVTLGEPLVKLAAFGYGVRRALSAETRNRIAFEMRREVKRARKQRRRAARRARVTPPDAEEVAA